MMNKKLHDPGTTKEILKKYGFSLTKGLGQNFLIDGSVIENTCDAAGITKDDCIIEIGPGIGTLTQFLCERANKVVSIEIDRDLIEIHKETLPYENLKIIYDDFMKMDLEKIISEEFGDSNVKVVANIPYYITTPIVMKILEDRVKVESITVMIQKEVAERFQSPPGSKEYGAISAVIQYYANPEIKFIVPKTVFIPQPKVDSAVIVMKIYEEPPVDVKDEKLFFNLIKGAFGQRRKTIINSVSGTIRDIDKNKLKEVLENLGYNPSIRGEKLGIEDFAKISNSLAEQ
ncbi:16S rRNA (adenine1518-N6/adenine1519-N6)-dimethyltransferase [Dethiosulfatibacter aminovorans DSM 17477]|uniref:Ribosomal RNA small subunit methyltransferase A n=1 Tax=Dethiosulfatibacter aminovorans DSM 17477 TaxID=1121476 RepID=A0A1M6JHF2_9FIRM|nr:16S rRNA (adenine1518-N6/adenine1519-N6)-dimethyltransferase [Dethiosulfatibacter aminovorans DSM 17477]